MLTNRENHLENPTGGGGYYYADTHQIICVDRVEMRNDKYELKGDSVVYDTDTDQAHSSSEPTSGTKAAITFMPTGDVTKSRASFTC